MDNEIYNRRQSDFKDPVRWPTAEFIAMAFAARNAIPAGCAGTGLRQPPRCKNTVAG